MKDKHIKALLPIGALRRIFFLFLFLIFNETRELKGVVCSSVSLRLLS